MIRKIFGLGDIKYSWILVLSSIIFGISNYMDRIYLSDPLWVHTCYWISIAIAVLWVALNYISHIRMNSLYMKQDDVQRYVNQLAMSDEDKLELRTYLEDFVEDLMEQGSTEEEAKREAIKQFMVKEFLSLSKNTMFFNLHAHYYLIGWTIVFISASMLVWLFEYAIFPHPIVTLTVESILIVYAIGLFGTFFMYKIMDTVIVRKYKALF